MTDDLTHPAKFSKQVLNRFRELLAEHAWTSPVLDPFAGVGKLGDIFPDAIGLEIEPRWAAMGATRMKVEVGDATAMRFPDATFGLVITSPSYGNRLADSHNAKDPCKKCDGSGLHEGKPCRFCRGKGLSHRNTYTHHLGEPLQRNNTGGMQWGSEYRRIHLAAWAETVRVMQPMAPLFLNVSDHIRAGRRMKVSAWHVRTLLGLGLSFEDVVPVATDRLREGANHDLRVDSEWVFVLRKL
jgi:hypothetical protein